MRRLIARFTDDQHGTVLIETLIAIPVMVTLTFGIMEFGSLMWQRQQLQIGVRDAARYWSRCKPTFSTGCDITKAQNIAFYGNPNGDAFINGNGDKIARVPGWDNDGVTTELIIQPATPPASPGPNDIVIVEGRVTYQGTPLFDAVFGSTIEIGYFHTTRYQGW